MPSVSRFDWPLPRFTGFELTRASANSSLEASDLAQCPIGILILEHKGVALTSVSSAFLASAWAFSRRSEEKYL